MCYKSMLINGLVTDIVSAMSGFEAKPLVFNGLAPQKKRQKKRPKGRFHCQNYAVLGDKRSWHVKRWGL